MYGPVGFSKAGKIATAYLKTLADTLTFAVTEAFWMNAEPWLKMLIRRGWGGSAAWITGAAMRESGSIASYLKSSLAILLVQRIR